MPTPATAGAKSGTATIGLESDGTGTSGIAGNVALGTQTVNVTGNVYRWRRVRHRPIRSISATST